MCMGQVNQGYILFPRDVSTTSFICFEAQFAKLVPYDLAKVGLELKRN